MAQLRAVVRVPASTTVGLLTSIWQSLLHRSPIGVDDNFFSLGGNRRIADLLFADIARKLGSGTTERHDLPGSDDRGFGFCVGSAQPSALLAFCPNEGRHRETADSDSPVWMAALVSPNSQSGFKRSIRSMGFRPRVLTGWRIPSTALRTWPVLCRRAQRISALRTLHPDRLLVGGLVALEMAQRLSDSGKQVGLLVLIDAYPHPRNLSSGQRVRLSVQRAARHISEMKEKPIRGAVAYLF